MRPLTHDELTYATVHQQQSLCMRWGLICTRWWPMPPILSKRFIQNHKQVILNFLSQKLEERLGSKMDETSYVAIIHWFKLIFNWMWEPTWSIEGIKFNYRAKNKRKRKAQDYCGNGITNHDGLLPLQRQPGSGQRWPETCCCCKCRKRSKRCRWRRKS